MNSSSQPSRYALHLSLLEKAKRVTNAHPDEIISVWGTNMRCYYASPSTDSIPGGYSAQEMIGRHASEFVEVRDIAHMALTKSDVELTGKSIDMTLEIRNKLGDRVRLRSRTVLLKDPDTGKVLFLTRSVPAGQSLGDLDDSEL